jgi:hypothetical protein
MAFMALANLLVEPAVTEKVCAADSPGATKNLYF